MKVAYKNSFILTLVLCIATLGNLYANVTTESTNLSELYAIGSENSLDFNTNDNLGLSISVRDKHFATEILEGNEEEFAENVAARKIDTDNGDSKIAFFYAQNFGSFYAEPKSRLQLKHIILNNAAKIYIRHQVLLI
ncbi:hypothetical protein M4I21_06975 [Cellulophaga sp. 20_2_10]|uniref:hypothetical protein n=1 Tax=Cellulophaga sp. 20_2_10 TaxID=2942476 RepID=UPI00201AD177|nr:hypothetical protein [Cellulophaga sp. 20_2_10]MCL5245543.1 hypothetical protein [Cellulophaga sp. 20_2_10]